MLDLKEDDSVLYRADLKHFRIVRMKGTDTFLPDTYTSAWDIQLSDAYSDEVVSKKLGTV